MCTVETYKSLQKKVSKNRNDLKLFFFKSPIHVGTTTFDTTTLRIWYFSVRKTYIHFVAHIGGFLENHEKNHQKA